MPWLCEAFKTMANDVVGMAFVWTVKDLKGSLRRLAPSAKCPQCLHVRLSLRGTLVPKKPMRTQRHWRQAKTRPRQGNVMCGSRCFYTATETDILHLRTYMFSTDHRWRLLPWRWGLPAVRDSTMLRMSIQCQCHTPHCLSHETYTKSDRGLTEGYLTKDINGHALHLVRTVSQRWYLLENDLVKLYKLPLSTTLDYVPTSIHPLLSLSLNPSIWVLLLAPIPSCDAVSLSKKREMLEGSLMNYSSIKPMSQRWQAQRKHRLTAGLMSLKWLLFCTAKYPLIVLPQKEGCLNGHTARRGMATLN